MEEKAALAREREKVKAPYDYGERTFGDAWWPGQDPDLAAKLEDDGTAALVETENFSKAAEELHDAALGVAFAAQELESNAELWGRGSSGGGEYVVDADSMNHLREQIKRWTNASNATLAAIAKLGARNA